MNIANMHCKHSCTTLIKTLVSFSLVLTICMPVGLAINTPPSAQAADFGPGSVITGTLICVDDTETLTQDGIPTDGYYQYQGGDGHLFKYQIRSSDDYGRLAESFNGNWFWMECTEHGIHNPATGDIYNFVFNVEGVYGKIITGTMSAGINLDLTGSDEYHQGMRARMTVSYTPPTGGLQINKESDASNITEGNPLYKLGGIEFGVWSDPDCNSDTHGTGKSIRLDENGYGIVKDLREGTYYIRELPDSLNGTNYAYNGSLQHATVTGGTNDVWIHYTANGLGDIDGNDITNSPITDEMNLRISKKDAETGGDSGIGAASLAGAKFKLSYFPNTSGSTSGNPERVWYYLTDKTGSISCMDEHALLTAESSALYKNAAGDTTLPVGTYALEEVKPPAGYLPAVNARGEKIVYTFLVTADGSNSAHGTRVYYTNQNGNQYQAAHADDGIYAWPDSELIVSDQVMRGDIQFNKLDDNSTPIANCPFLLRAFDDNGAVIEQHVIVTDENGIFDSSYGHSISTNANDAALTVNTDGSYKIDSSKLNPNAGIWFGIDANGMRTNPDDAKGAMPYGRYELIELVSQANINLQLVESRGVKITHDKQLVDLGTITDKTPEIKTAASDSADGDALLTADSQAGITDVVSYENLNPGQEYTVSGMLIDKTSASPLVDAHDQTIGSQKTFVPSSANGTISLDFSFDASALADNLDLVVFEKLTTGDNILVAAHEDVNDLDQTIRVVKPNIKTSIQDKLDGDRVIVPSESVTLVDTLSYSGLTVGKRYDVSGVLVNKANGHELEIDGQPVTAKTSFIAQNSQGETPVTFKFNSTEIANNSEYVAFETLSRDGVTLAVHADLHDAKQTFVMERPLISTSAADEIDGDRLAYADTDTTIVDTLSYKGLTVGESYTVRGTLMDKNTGTELRDASGNTVTAEKEFVPITSSGNVIVPFTFDASHINAGLEAVAFETLLHEETELATHADINDKGQTVTLIQPRIDTSAHDALDGGKIVCRDLDARVIDTVSYTGLKRGARYTLNGILMDKATKAPVKDADGNEIRATQEFVAQDTTGKIDVEFAFDATAVKNGSELVCFETLSRDGQELATHLVLEDAEQTVTVQPPTISTSAHDSDDEDKLVFSDEHVSIIDIVTYTGLTPGKEYKLEASLMDQETQAPAFDANGNKIKGEQGFVPETPSGAVELRLEFDASHITQELTLVVFENLLREGRVLATHADINDSAQMVTITPPSIQTSAVDAGDNDKNIMRGQQAVITDHVSYGNLTAQEEYTLIGTLMIDDGTLTGSTALDAFGEPIRTVQNFTPSEPYGDIDISFDLDSTLFDKDTKTVVFEKLQHNGATIATHEDIRNKEQAVSVSYPALKTYAADGRDGGQELAALRDSEIIDTVEYSGLNTGETYTVHGKLMDKASGDPIKVNGREITAKSIFVATDSSGEAEVKFSFDASGLTGKDIVAFERLDNSDKITMATHQDINDAKQTVHVVSSAPGSTFTRALKSVVKTGDARFWIIIAYLVCGAAALVVFATLRKRSR